MIFVDGCLSFKIYILFFSIVILVVVYLFVFFGSENGILCLLMLKIFFLLIIIFNVMVDINNVIVRVDEKFVLVCLIWRRRDVWKFNVIREKRFKVFIRVFFLVYV